jgi:hypothetical protein
MKKRIVIPLLVLLLVLVLCISAVRPPVLFGSGLSEEARKAVQSQSAGLYSRRLPLVPLFVTVDRLESQRVYYTIWYFPVGCVGMSWEPTDGYNMEKPLTGL